MRTYVFDLDGTLADCQHRLKYIDKSLPKKDRDYAKFYEECINDTPIWPVINLLNDLELSNNIIIVTARSDECRELTLQWLEAHCIEWNRLIFAREEGDYREDSILKQKVLDQLRADGVEISMVFDDRKRVVDMWRANGVSCAQVAEGDF